MEEDWGPWAGRGLGTMGWKRTGDHGLEEDWRPWAGRGLETMGWKRTGDHGLEAITGGHI